MTRWKAVERRVARRVGGRRLAVDGTRGSVDVAHPLFGFQVKSRRRIPTWLGEWLTTICATARLTDRIGVLVLHRPGQRLDDAIVCVRFEDWTDLHGPLTPQATPAETPPAECHWTEDEDGHWHSGCAHVFEFHHTGGPRDHAFTVCPWCGRQLVPHPFVPPTMPDEDSEALS